jgi:NodT family efflux transporter outer membrane factor (OMF) lipoprotein
MYANTKTTDKNVAARPGRILSLVLVSSLSLLACGCGLTQWVHNGFKVGPEYGCPPAAEVAESWIDADAAQIIPCPSDCPDWWATFNDPILNHLIETAYQQNLSLREAGWRVMQTRAQRAYAAGSLFPQTQLGFGEFERIQESQSVALPAPLRAFDQWSTGFNLAWELDVWGRFRRSITSADANLDASIGDYDAILLSLIADVATAYADYRTFEQRLEYARHNVKIQEGSLELTQEKYDAGSTGMTSVHLAKSSLESTKARIPSYEIGLRQANNQLCTLLGVSTHDLQQALGKAGIPIAPPEVAIGIPADLIRRRPDIRAAERSIAAQSEQIGIAQADLYPHFVIQGEFALQSEDFSDLFQSASTAGSIGPSVQWNLLNYGRIINNVRLQESGLQELIANYQNTVLTANQEVEDALVAFLKNQQRVRYLKTVVDETQEALRLLTISFNEGDISFTGVFIMQGDLAAKQDQLAQAQGDVATSLIALYKAIGGGWEIRCMNLESQLPHSLPSVELELLPVPDGPAIEPMNEPTTHTPNNARSTTANPPPRVPVLDEPSPIVEASAQSASESGA